MREYNYYKFFILKNIKAFIDKRPKQLKPSQKAGLFLCCNRFGPLPVSAFILKVFKIKKKSL